MNFNFLTSTATDAANQQGGGMGMLLVYGVLIVVIIVAFVFMNRKQKKQDKEIADMRNSLRVGDEVTTTGGIVGRIVRVKEDTVVLETTREGTKIRFIKSAIARVDVPYGAPKDSSKENSK